jgi:hypothetical protein
VEEMEVDGGWRSWRMEDGGAGGGGAESKFYFRCLKLPLKHQFMSFVLKGKYARDFHYQF